VSLARLAFSNSRRMYFAAGMTPGPPGPEPPVEHGIEHGTSGDKVRTLVNFSSKTSTLLKSKIIILRRNHREFTMVSKREMYSASRFWKSRIS
jgi:hypothetical protein